MRDRLIELLSDTLSKYNLPEHIADELLADGWIRPPCKVGTHIWVIPTKQRGLTEITEMVVRGFAIGEPCNVANCFRVRGTCALYQPSFGMFGESVFFTPEEAEKALKEREGNENKSQNRC